MNILALWNYLFEDKNESRVSYNENNTIGF